MGRGQIESVLLCEANTPAGLGLGLELQFMFGGVLWA